MKSGVISPGPGSLSNVATGMYSSTLSVFWRSNTTYGSMGPAFITAPCNGAVQDGAEGYIHKSWLRGLLSLSMEEDELSICDNREQSTL